LAYASAVQTEMSLAASSVALGFRQGMADSSMQNDQQQRMKNIEHTMSYMPFKMAMATTVPRMINLPFHI